MGAGGHVRGDYSKIPHACAALLIGFGPLSPQKGLSPSDSWDLRSELALDRERPRPNWSQIPPDKHCVYVIYCDGGGMPDFKEVSNGGSFKKHSPTVPVGTLKDAWVDGAFLLNVGETHGTTMNLRKRIKRYIRCGLGKATGHYGGRYAWQLPDDMQDDLLVAWKWEGVEDPQELEVSIARAFRAQHSGKYPFAFVERKK
jgi:hypothetical protein